MDDAESIAGCHDLAVIGNGERVDSNIVSAESGDDFLTRQIVSHNVDDLAGLLSLRTSKQGQPASFQLGLLLVFGGMPSGMAIRRAAGEKVP